MKESKFEKIIWAILEFWGHRALYITVFVFVTSFIFTSMFGNFPQWKYEAETNELKAYFEPLIDNIIYNGMSQTANAIHLTFTYSDGSD